MHTNQKRNVRTIVKIRTEIGEDPHGSLTKTARKRFTTRAEKDHYLRIF